MAPTTPSAMGPPMLKARMVFPSLVTTSGSRIPQSAVGETVRTGWARPRWVPGVSEYPSRRVAAVLNRAAHGCRDVRLKRRPNVPDHHRERSFVPRPVEEVQNRPDAVSSNLSDDDSRLVGRERNFVADCRDKMADDRDAIADAREAPADIREEEHDRRERERTRGPTPSGSHRSSPRPPSNGKPAGRRASTPGKNGCRGPD